MHSPSLHSTAILIFSRSAREEARIKQFGCRTTAAQNLRIAQLLIRRTRQLAKRTGLSVFEIRSDRQRGATFGARLSNALTDVFAQGCQRVLCIGNDCPALLPQHLLAAARQLTIGKLVMGADHNGGLYLIGLNKAQFHAAELEALPWQSGHDAVALQQYAVQHADENVYVAPCLSDIDNVEDLLSFLQNASALTSFIRQLHHLLETAKQWIYRQVIWRSDLYLPLPYLRGPPVR